MISILEKLKESSLKFILTIAFATGAEYRINIQKKALF